MNKIFTIAYREYMAMVATKTFLITLFMMPILMFGGIALMPALTKLSGGQTRRIILIDGTSKLGPLVKQAADTRNLTIGKAAEEASKSNGNNKSREEMSANDIFQIEIDNRTSLDDKARLELSDDIRNGKLYAFVEIPESVLNVDGVPTQVKFVSQDAMLSEARGWLGAILDGYVRGERLPKLGVDPALLAKVTAPISVEPSSLYSAKAGDTTGTQVETPNQSFGLAQIFLPMGLMMLMFLVIFLAAQPMLESAMEEKSQRIAEVLLGAVSPTQLMAGKLLGNCGASLLVFCLYGIGGYYLLYNRDLHNLVPLSIIPWFVLFQILGVLFYSSIFMAIGASVRELKEAQSLLLPIWLILMLPLMVWFVVLRDPLGPIGVGLSLFPPSAGMMNVLRLGTGTSIPIWQPLLGATLLAISTAIVVWLAGRIYRASLLRGDSVKSFMQMISRITASTR